MIFRKSLVHFILTGILVFIASSLFAPPIQAQARLELEDYDGKNGYAINGLFGGISEFGADIETGDFNNDGVDDFIIGARGETALDGGSNVLDAGRTYIVFGTKGSAPAVEFDLTTIDGTNGYILEGIDEDDFSGKAVHAADVNNDGYDDAIVGAYHADPGGQARGGETYILYGDELSAIDANDSSTDGTIGLGNVNTGQGFTVLGKDSTDQSGWQLSSGDIDNDGYEDLLIGARLADIGSTEYDGESYLLFGDQLTHLDANGGSPNGIIQLSDVGGAFGYTFLGINENDQAGRSLATGDVDGDGKDDIFIGASGASVGGDKFVGETYVLLASQLATLDAADGNTNQFIDLGNITSSTGYVLRGVNSVPENSAWRLASGDVNNDGFDEVIISAIGAKIPDSFTFDVGATYVAFGDKLTDLDAAGSLTDGIIALEDLNGTTGFAVRGIDEDDASGHQLATGDFNNDGADDILIGAEPADSRAETNYGETYIIYGRENEAFEAEFRVDTLSKEHGFVFEGVDEEDYSGEGLASGDVDGDGEDDIIIGATGANPINAAHLGQVYAITYPFYEKKITGSEGFRLLSTPANGNILDEFLDPFWTQGLNDGDKGTSFDDNVFFWTNIDHVNFPDIGDWTGLDYLRFNTLNAGQGFLFYMFNDEDNDGVNEGFPKSLFSMDFFSLGTLNSGDVTAFSDLKDGSFYLAGNPYLEDINWDAASGWTKTNLSNTIYVWSDSANSGTGAWLSWNGISGTKPDSGLISPYQGFFVEVSGGEGTLEITENAIADSPATFYKQKDIGEHVVINLSVEGQRFSDKAVIQFSEDASIGKDRYDGLQMQPLSSEYLNVFTSSGEDKVSLNINALPLNQNVVELPLFIEKVSSHQNPSKNATLSVDVQQQLPEDWSIHLIDTQTGEKFDMLEESSADVDLEVTKKQQGKALGSFDVPMEFSKNKSNSEHRYALRLKTGTTVSNSSQPNVPQTIELNQNYPNPFNPTTTIRYGVPEAGPVSLEVFNMLGKRVATLVNENQNAGTYDVDFNAGNLTSGVYVYRLSVRGKTKTKKLTLIK